MQQRRWQAQEEARQRQEETPADGSPPDGPVAQGPASTIPLPTPPEPVLADLSSRLGRETYPTWMHAADADVASRQGRLEARIEDLDASVSLLPTKMETIIGQLAAREPEKEEPMPTTKHWTSKDLETFPDDGTRYEIIDGDLYVSHQPSWHHQYTCSQLIYVLQAWSHTTSLGAATGAPGLIFAEDQDVAPDVVWISHTRLQGTLDQAGHLTRAPELVIEVLSPGSANVRRDREVKLSLYSRRSVDEYWIVDPVAQTIDVYRQQAGRLAHVAWLTREDTLTSPGLPGFTCAVAGLFDTRTMSPRSP